MWVHVTTETRRGYQIPWSAVIDSGTRGLQPGTETWGKEESEPQLAWWHLPVLLPTQETETYLSFRVSSKPAWAT